MRAASLNPAPALRGIHCLRWEVFQGKRLGWKNPPWIPLGEEERSPKPRHDPEPPGTGDSLCGGGGLDAPVGGEGPVLPSVGPEGAFLGVLVDLQLVGLLVTLLVLVGREIHPCRAEADGGRGGGGTHTPEGGPQPTSGRSGCRESRENPTEQTSRSPG